MVLRDPRSYRRVKDREGWWLALVMVLLLLALLGGLWWAIRFPDMV